MKLKYLLTEKVNAVVILNRCISITTELFFSFSFFLRIFLVAKFSILKELRNAQSTAALHDASASKNLSQYSYVQMKAGFVPKD